VSPRAQLVLFLLLPSYITSDRQTSDRRQTKASLNAPPIRGGGIKMMFTCLHRAVQTMLREEFSVRGIVLIGYLCTAFVGYNLKSLLKTLKNLKTLL